MLARIAQELFWLGRDLTRAEYTARMVDGVYHAHLQERSDDPGAVLLSWDALVAIVGADPTRPGHEDVVRMLTVDAGSPGSVVSCIRRGRERARTLRGVISSEMWEAVNTVHLDLGESDVRAALDIGPYGLFHYVKERSALFWGIVERTMLRDEAHCFLQAGGRIEAADMVLRVLRVALPPEADEAEARRDGERERAGSLDGEADALLHTLGGFQAYRRVSLEAPDAAPVARFLLFEPGYPGSVAFSIEALERALHDADADSRTSRPGLRLGRLMAELASRRHGAPLEGDVVSALSAVQEQLALVDREIDARYFAGAEGATLAPQP